MTIVLILQINVVSVAFSKKMVIEALAGISHPYGFQGPKYQIIVYNQIFGLNCLDKDFTLKRSDSA